MENTDNMTLWQELKYRWTTAAPVFWQKILNLALFLGSGAVALISADAVWDLQSVLHPMVFVGAKYAIAVAATLGLSAKLTVNK